MPSDLRTALVTFVLGKNPDLDPAGLTGSTALFEQRHLRSIHLPELLLLIERITATPVDVENLRPGDFRDLETIVGRFS